MPAARLSWRAAAAGDGEAVARLRAAAHGAGGNGNGAAGSEELTTAEVAAWGANEGVVHARGAPRTVVHTRVGCDEVRLNPKPYTQMSKRPSISPFLQSAL